MPVAIVTATTAAKATQVPSQNNNHAQKQGPLVAGALVAIEAQQQPLPLFLHQLEFDELSAKCDQFSLVEHFSS